MSIEGLETRYEEMCESHDDCDFCKYTKGDCDCRLIFGYDQGVVETIDKIYSHVKRECNPYGKPTIDFESGKKILNYLDQLKEQKNE